jgi:hypothetical protein
MLYHALVDSDSKAVILQLSDASPVPRKSQPYSTVSLPKDLIDAVRAFIRRPEGLGFRSIAEYIAESVRSSLALQGGKGGAKELDSDGILDPRALEQLASRVDRLEAELLLGSEQKRSKRGRKPVK